MSKPKRNRHSPATQGIQTRTDSKGRTRHRGTAWDRRARRNVFGPWTPNLAEARHWRVDALARLQAGTMSADIGPTVRDAVERFLDGIESGALRDRSGNRYKPSTIRSYASPFAATSSRRSGRPGCRS